MAPTIRMLKKSKSILQSIQQLISCAIESFINGDPTSPAQSNALFDKFNNMFKIQGTHDDKDYAVYKIFKPIKAVPTSLLDYIQLIKYPRRSSYTPRCKTTVFDRFYSHNSKKEKVI